MRKHAYLIIAHHQFEQLAYLLTLLDDIRNDIYIMIDKKSAFTEKQQHELYQIVKNSKLIFTKRIAIYWSDYSQIEAELCLFKTAYENEMYDYYHLLSGCDLPLQNQDKIHKFFKANPRRIFITAISKHIYNAEHIDRRIRYKHLFTKLNERSFGKIIGKFITRWRYIEEIIQEKLGIDQLKKYNVYKGFSSNWCSIDNESVEILLKEELFIKKLFKGTTFTDELLLPIIFHKNQLQHKFFVSEGWSATTDELQGNLRYINWWDGSPYTWTDSHRDLKLLDKAIENGHLFARKFDIEKYPKIKKYIIEKMKD